MHENVPVRFGRGRLDSLATKGLAAYLIARPWPIQRTTWLVLGPSAGGGSRQAILRMPPVGGAGEVPLGGGGAAGELAVEGVGAGVAVGGGLGQAAEDD